MKTTKDVLKECRIEGIKMSERTFDFYSRELGLLPRPFKKVHGEGGRGVHNVYQDNIIDRIKEIYRLKKEGKTLNQISFHFYHKELKEFTSLIDEVTDSACKDIFKYLFMLKNTKDTEEHFVVASMFNNEERELYYKLKSMI